MFVSCHHFSCFPIKKKIMANLREKRFETVFRPKSSKTENIVFKI